MDYKEVIVKRDRVAAIKRRHPWIFSGGIIDHEGCEDGDIVKVMTRKGEFLALGYFQNGSIMVRVLSFAEERIDDNFWSQKIQEAQALRKNINLPSGHTDAYRLVHGEGDGLSGLIVDIYADVAVIQCHTIGMHQRREDIARALDEYLELDSIYVKSGKTLPRDYAVEQSDYFIKGSKSEIVIKEHDCQFIINVVSGQKTGFFLDQRENRQLLKSFAKDKSILNLFSYSGGFSIYGLKGEASSVVSVDVSAKAIELCDRNVALTEYQTNHESLTVDVNSYLVEIPKDTYDIIVVDPPAFAKSVRKKHNAIQAYKRVNAAAIRKVKSGGLIFSFSCSQVIDSALFYHTITAASIEAGRPCQVLHHLSQGPDHPVSIFHPEGKYLKGLVMKVT